MSRNYANAVQGIRNFLEQSRSEPTMRKQKIKSIGGERRARNAELDQDQQYADANPGVDVALWVERIRKSKQPKYEDPNVTKSTEKVDIKDTGGYDEAGTDVGSWKEIQERIFKGESGGDYDALFNYTNRKGKRFENVKLTDMTVDEAIAFSDPQGEYASYVKGEVGRVATPVGAYQVVGTTLRGAKEGLGLKGNEKMDKATQDKIGKWIYRTQGTGAWEGYE